MHLAYVSRQAVTHSSFMGFFFGLCGPLPFPLPWEEYTVSRFPFPASGADTHRLSRAAPLPHYHSLLVVQDAWQPYQTGLRTTGSMAETWLPLLLASWIKLLDCAGEVPAFLYPLARSFHRNIPRSSNRDPNLCRLCAQGFWVNGETCLPPPCLGLLSILLNILPQAFGTKIWGPLG